MSMSRRRELQKRAAGLGEIEGIMIAMKNLAFMEIQKLTRFITTQLNVVTTIETIASDFITHYGNVLPRSQSVAHDAYLLIGSERGFCGDFNESIVKAVQEQLGEPSTPPVIVVGHRLAAKLEGYPGLAAVIEGPSIAEEVDSMLISVVSPFTQLERKLLTDDVLGLVIVYHSSETGNVEMRRLLPRPELKPEPKLYAHQFSHAPLLTLAPADFLAKLTEHYLYAALHESFYSSMMVENQYRLDHMDNAIRQLDKRMTEFMMRSNCLRQEEITGEIEIIMLSVETLANQD
jgi:F-type H+-transporting ATPase subunit gamma